MDFDSDDQSWESQISSLECTSLNIDIWSSHLYHECLVYMPN